MTSYKRVLVLSHNPFSRNQNNGKTLEAFFKEWDKEAIAQLYLQPETPDFDFCDNYFRVTDYDVLNSILSKGKVGDIVINDKNLNVKKGYSPIVDKLYQERRNGTERKSINKLIHNAFVSRIPIFLMAREIIWKIGRWKSHELTKWISNFKPDVLFFQGSNGVFGYEIALWICKEFEIPLVLELTDDYTRGLYDYSVIEKFNKSRYRKIFRKAISISKKVITISDIMTEEYKSIYGGDFTVLMNSVERIEIGEEPSGLRLIYAGNLSLNRWQVLLNIGKALDQINLKMSKDYHLDVYTPMVLSSEVSAILKTTNSLRLGGSLNQEELAKQIRISNVLVHVESFETKMKRITRLSISTKIPEYMASKRCIFAVGPSDVASMIYLKENNYALVVNSESVGAIEDGLMELIENLELRNQLINKAYEGFIQRHQPSIVQKTIYEVIEDACRT